MMERKQAAKLLNWTRQIQAPKSRELAKSAAACEIRRTLAFSIGNARAWQSKVARSMPFDAMMVDFMMFSSLNLSTRGKYAASAARYQAWGAYHDVESIFPISGPDLQMWCMHRIFVDEIAVGTLRSGLSALNTWHKEWQYEDWKWQELPGLHRMIQGMSRTLGRPRENQRKAFTVSLLRRWVVELGVPVHDWNYYTIFAGIVVCIFGMLRGAEGFARTAHHPVPEDTRRIQDLTIHEQEGYAVLHLATSKSDPFSEGVAILLPMLDEKQICPVRILQQYLALRKLRAVRNHQLAITPKAWLFCMENGRPACVTRVRAYMSTVLSELGENASGYNTHSFRIGGATSLHRQGVPIEMIKRLGRWKSQIVEIYIRHNKDLCARWAAQMALPEFVNKDIVLWFGDEFRQ